MLHVHAQSIPPQVRHQEIFRAFDALLPGDAFVLVNSHAPWPLLNQFQSLRPSAFEWNVLESGPATFRVEVRKRVEAKPRTVQEFLSDDHRRLDALLARAKVSKNGLGVPRATDSREESGPAGLEAFQEFAVGLERHIALEEVELFPVFEQLVGAIGPLVVMRKEHGAILAALRGALESGVDELPVRIRELERLLVAHNLKEEQILYPMTDARLTEADREALVNALQRCDA